MKKLLVAVTALSVVAGATMAFADSNIKNSKHDMKSRYGATAGASAGTSTQICVYCHTPHNAISTMPLWNRQNGVSATSFTLYSSQTMQSSVRATGFTADSMSLFCMSCHDGSPVGGTMVVNKPMNGDTLSDNTVKITNTTPIGTNRNGANLGTDLRTTHPVNFSLKDNGLGLTGDGDFSKAGQARNDGATSDLVWNGSVGYMGKNPNPTFPLFKATGRGNSAVECSSCHAVHDNFYEPFLRSTMAASALCLGCHRK
jgi:predicted CXXCH cytochrome family protein